MPSSANQEKFTHTRNDIRLCSYNVQSVDRPSTGAKWSKREQEYRRTEGDVRAHVVNP